jgi:hypothetical protein
VEGAHFHEIGGVFWEVVAFEQGVKCQSLNCILGC